MKVCLCGYMLLLLFSACGTETPAPEVRRLPTEVILPTPTLIPPTLTTPATLEPTLPPGMTFTASSTETRMPYPTPPQVEIPTATATEVRYAYIAIAMQPIPAGYAIPPEAVILYPWPAESVPFSAILTVDDVVNKVALADIHCFEPFVEPALALREVGTGFETLESCPVLPPQTGEVTLVNVVIATQFVEAGVTIRPGMVAMQQWPVEIRPAGTIGRFADVIGKEARENLIPELPIYADVLVGS